jgi:hypothetical protein
MINKVYGPKAPEAVSWYRPHLEISLKLIERAAPDFSASIIDVGGGESTLVDDLLAHGYKDVTVLDVSQTAIDVSKMQLGETSERVKWLVADITKADVIASCLRCMARPRSIPFLNRDRRTNSLCSSGGARGQAGGHEIVDTFGPEGPEVPPFDVPVSM